MMENTTKNWDLQWHLLNATIGTKNATVGPFRLQQHLLNATIVLSLQVYPIVAFVKCHNRSALQWRLTNATIAKNHQQQKQKKKQKKKTKTKKNQKKKIQTLQLAQQLQNETQSHLKKFKIKHNMLTSENIYIQQLHPNTFSCHRPTCKKESSN